MNRYLAMALVFAGFTPVYSQTVLNPGADVQGAVNAAPAGATIALNPGTYTLAGSLAITKPLTLKSNAAGIRPVLQLPGSTVVGIDVKANNVTLDGLRVAGSAWGIFAGDSTAPHANLVVRNLAISATGTNNPGHGIFVTNLSNAIVDSNVIEAAPFTGILIDSGSLDATVTNNTVAGAGAHGIGVINSDSCLIAGNSITGAHDFGIIIQGSRFCRIERNRITGAKQDGIVVTKNDISGTVSQYGYVGRNTVVSNGLASGNPAGTGIWLNSESNGMLVYGNKTSGAPENGFTIFNSSNDWFWGNTTSSNGHGGIFIYGPTNLHYSSGPQPSNNFVQGNHTFELPANAGIFVNQSTTTTIFNNMFRNSPAGMLLQNTSANRLYLNILRANFEGYHALLGTTGTTYFLNRHLEPIPNHADAGTNGVFDGGPVFGGNYQSGGKVLTDRYPYGVETLSRPASIRVTLPAAGTVAAAGTQKTIEWTSTACTYVDLSYKPAGAPPVSIAPNYPDVGVYQWTVPVVAAGSYAIVIDCKNSAGTSLAASSSSAAFTIATAGLELLSPQNNHRVNSGETTKVTWARSPSTSGPVNVLYRPTAGGTPTTLASNVSTNDATVTVPGGGSSQGQFLVQLASDGGISDSTDGFVNVRSTTPAVTGPSGTVGIGTLQLVQWSSHPSTVFVDIEYFDTTSSTYQTLVTNLPDFGRFHFLVPDKTMTNSSLRVRFKSSTAAAITTANSGAFNTAVNGSSNGGGTPPTAPTVGSITPASGTGASQAFTVTYSDVNGASDITYAFLMVNSTINAANSCFIQYDRAANNFVLRNDTDTAFSAPIPPGSGSVSNSQCTLNGAGSSASLSGNTLTVVYQITFPAGNASTKNTYGFATDTPGLGSGWKQLGSWTIAGDPQVPTTPQVISLSPSSGSGLSGTFTAGFRHAGGPTKHYLGYMLFLPLPNVVSFIAQGTCLIEYNRISNGMRLIDNAGTGWLGPLPGVPVAPTTPPLSNNACTVNVAGASATLSGNDMIVTVPVTFKSTGLTAVVGSFIQEQDVNGQWTDFRQFGVWQVPGGSTIAGPYVSTAAPVAGSGVTGNINISVGHTSSAGSIGQVHIRLDSVIVGPTPCHAVYFPLNNTIALVNDTGSGLVGPVTFGSALATNRCNLGAGGTRAVSGSNIMLSLPYTFNPGAFSGSKNIYVSVFDIAGKVSHWVQTGTWIVP